MGKSWKGFKLSDITIKVRAGRSMRAFIGSSISVSVIVISARLALAMGSQVKNFPEIF